MDTNDELLDLVDENDKVVGTVLRSEVREKGVIKNVRVINAFVRNSRGEIWFPRRTANKRLFPLGLDMSVGGCVGCGETYEEAFRRETMEEINVDTEKFSYKFLGKLTPRGHSVSSFMKVYEIKMDSTPDYNREDFCEYFWLSPQAFLERVRNGEKTKEDLPKLVKHFYPVSNSG